MGEMLRTSRESGAKAKGGSREGGESVGGGGLERRAHHAMPMPRLCMPVMAAISP